jgi:replicative DNA helicase
MSAGNNAEMQNKNVMEAIATIKILTEVTNSLGIVLSQLRKKNDNRQTHFPRVDDLEWSGLTKQISDVVGLCFWAWKINSDTAQMNWYTVSWQKVRDADPFNEVLWVMPEICDFKRHPQPNIGREYFNW